MKVFKIELNCVYLPLAHCEDIMHIHEITKDAASTKERNDAIHKVEKLLVIWIEIMLKYVFCSLYIIMFIHLLLK